MSMTTGRKLSIGQCAELACMLEAAARKPGNVHREAEFEELRFVDLLASAVAIGPVLDRASELGVGPSVLECVTATRDLVGTNTNLGMILLIAPLAVVPVPEALPSGVAAVLERLRVEDARAVYQAIRLARPGGLGRVAEQDLSGEPTQDLLSVMRLAADGDLVARQYAGGFREVFQDGVPSLQWAWAEGLDWEQTTIRCHLQLMARHPDSLIARKRGRLEAEQAARQASAVLDAGWPKNRKARQLFDELDAWLRAAGQQRNPGTTADLVAASLFAVLRDGTIELLRR